MRIVRPDGNRHSGKFGRAENLSKRFAAEIRRQERERLAMLLGWGTIRSPSKSRGTVDGRAVMTRYLHGKRLRLKGSRKGRAFRALVMRDGRIRFNGKLYHSPSLAGGAAVGRRSVNGWWFWHFERAPGDWVRLRELRG